MNPDKRTEAKLHSSLVSNELEEEVINKLAWYRTQLMETKREVRRLKNMSLWEVIKCRVTYQTAGSL